PLKTCSTSRRYCHGLSGPLGYRPHVHGQWVDTGIMPRLLSHAPNEMVGHDLGTMVAYAYAARYPDTTEQLVVMDAPVPGIPPWDDLVRHPLLWHFSFGGP